MSRNVLVTGGNSGVGLALCKLLIKDHDCYVFLGCRDVGRGATAMKSILDEVPEKADKIEVLQIDVGDDNSCTVAAEVLKAKNVKLYALVNNAGLFLNTNPEMMSKFPKILMNTNYMGPKRVTEAMIGIIDPLEGRIVNTSSDSGPEWLARQDEKTKNFFTKPDLTMAELDLAIKKEMSSHNPFDGYCLYCISKVGVNSLTLVQAKSYPVLKINSFNPGFIDTPMTKGYVYEGYEKLTPEQGCASALKCLFGAISSGHFYGEDGLRSPLTVQRERGAPEYMGESNPDPAKYSNA